MIYLDNTTDFFNVSIALKNRVLRELDHHFDGSYKIKERIRVISDLEKFRYKDDVSLWAQSKNYVAQEFVLYWDNEFICRFNTHHHIEDVMLMFWRGLKKALKEGKVGLFEPLPEPEDTLKAQLENIDKIETNNPTTKMAKNIVKKLIKRKHDPKPARIS